MRRNPVGWGGLLGGAAAAAILGFPGAAVAGAGAAGALVALTNFLVDPHERFRRPRRRRTWYSRPRHLNPGLARHREAATVLVGSSLLEGIRPSDAAQALGGPCLKLVVPAVSARELAALLDVILRAGRARRIVIPLDPFTFRGEVGRFGHGRRRFPVHLYRDGLLAALPYLLSLDTLATSRKVVRRHRGLRDHRQFDPELYGFEADRKDWGAGVVRRSFEAGSPERDYRPEEIDLGKFVANLETWLLPRIRGAPDVRFLLYFPPYSVLAWADNRRKGWFDAALGFRRAVFRRLAGLPNVTLHDFGAEAEIVTDLEEYRDVVHHSPAVDRRILARLGSGAPGVGTEALAAADAWIRSASETAKK